MKLPIIIINYKTYHSTIGEKGLQLTKIVEKVTKDTGVNFAVATNFADMRLNAQNTSVPVFSQHVDFHHAGRFTGYLLPEMIMATGAAGSLINHAEKPMGLMDVSVSVRRLRDLGLTSIVCVDSRETARAVASFHPDFISLEPPELIGTGVSVSKAKPDIVKDTAIALENISNIPLLCGAGVSTKEDVQKALKYGAKGILLASAVTKADDPEKILRELAAGIVNGSE
jgi:triosephosphate isomerase